MLIIYNCQNPWCSVFLANVVVSELLKTFLFKETESSSQRSQQPATGLRPESDECNPRFHITYGLHFNIVFPYMPRSPNRALSSRFANHNLYAYLPLAW
jgi:hypothetical protein